YTSELYDIQNQQMLIVGKEDPKTALALATRIKRNANVMKNYRGKLKGLQNLDLVDTKTKEDEALRKFIDSKPSLQARYGTLMADIVDYYRALFVVAFFELWFNIFFSCVFLLRVVY